MDNTNLLRFDPVRKEESKPLHNLQINRNTLHKAVKMLAGIVNNRLAPPVLHNIKVDLQDGNLLTLTATDLEQTLVYRHRNTVGGKDFSICLNAKLLNTLLKPEKGKKAALEEISIDVLEDHQTTLRMEDLESQVFGTNPKEFPLLPDGPEEDTISHLATWDSNLLKKALDYVLPAASCDESRRHLTTVYFDRDNLVTTDGHRLHLAKVPKNVPSSLLVPVGPVNTLIKLLPAKSAEVRIYQTDESLKFTVGPWELYTKIIDANFPPYERLIPSENSDEIAMLVETEIFTRALNRMLKISKESVTLSISRNEDTTLTMTAEDPDTGEIKTKVPLVKKTPKYEDRDLELSYDPTYLKEAANTSESTVWLEVWYKRDPFRLRSKRLNSWFALVMPVHD